MYYDKLIFDISVEGRKGYTLPDTGIKRYDLPNDDLLRDDCPGLPEVSELDVVRHYTNVSFKNFGIEKGFYPLGSCTMKYNPKINQDMAANPDFASLHPYQPESTVQGMLKLYDDLQRWLSEISGLTQFTLNSYAGAHGEHIGLMMIKAYHRDRGDTKRNKIIVPDSAHGTNPASASVAGLESVEVKSNPDGTVNVEALKDVLDDTVAGIMLTNPNTLGMFEKDILEIAKLVHEAGGLLYYDGANLNPLLGKIRPGDMGFDIMHINLHKTFSTPHGGGGPGSGPVGVAKRLVKYLPVPVVKKSGDKYTIERSNGTTLGQISHFTGNIGVAMKAYSYILTIGKEDLKNIANYSVLNANYIKESLKDVFKLPISGVCKHEFVFDGLKDKSTDVQTIDVAKRLLDFDMHPPTVYFPIIYKQSIMVEPPENESKQTIDAFIEAMRTIAKEAKEDPDKVKNAPYTTVVKRLDEALAARNPVVKYTDIEKK